MNVIQPRTFIDLCLTMAICAKNRNWDDAAYSKGVIEPCQKIKEMRHRLISENKEPEIAQMKAALEMLQSVFVTKQVPVNEQIERLRFILAETGTESLFGFFDIDGRQKA